MSMSTYVFGFKAPDDKWKKMKAIWDACKKANIEPPGEVDEYFDFEPPDSSGVQVDIDYHEYRDDCSEGIEIKVSEIPKDITSIRVVNS